MKLSAFQNLIEINRNDYLRKLFRFLVHLNTSLINFSGSLGHSEWAVRLKEHRGTTMSNFAHHIKSFLEANDTSLKVQIRSLLQLFERYVCNQAHEL